MKKHASILVALAFLAGCAGSDDTDGVNGAPAATNNNCAVTFSGEVDETKNCLMFINQITSTSTSSSSKLYIGGGTLDGLFGFNVLDVPTALATYQTGSTFEASGLLNDRTPAVNNLPHIWRLSDHSATLPDRGTYTIKLTAISQPTSGSGVKQWAVDGTLDATYEPDESSGATAPVTIHMDF